MTKQEPRILAAAAVLFALAGAVPLLDDSFLVSLGINILMFTVLATSWTLFSGPTRYISLATTAFFGVGMYVVAIGVETLPLATLVIAAGAVGALLAAVVGLATLRLSGVYFVIFTLGLAELIRQLVTWAQTTMGTSSGLFVFTDVTEPMIYWQLLILAAIVYLIGWRIGRSRLGFALRIIGNDETVAVHSGINTARAKLFLFIISGTIAAITGALLAPRWTYVEPTIAFNPQLSFLVVIMALFGGTHRLWGPLFGVVPFTLLWNFVRGNFPNQSTLVLGVAFLLIVYAIPNGIVGLVERMAQYRKLLTRAGHD